MKRISVVLVPVLLGAALVFPTGSAASAPAQASATGCAADPALEDRILVKKKPVLTEDGQRLGTLRFFAGQRLGRTGYSPRYCLDLVVAENFLGDRPRYAAILKSRLVSSSVNGRVHTGRLDGGNRFAEAGEKITVTFQTFRPDAHASMSLTYPDLGLL